MGALAEVELQEQKYCDAEQLHEALCSTGKTSPNSWSRYYRQGLLGANLASRKCATRRRTPLSQLSLASHRTPCRGSGLEEMILNPQQERGAVPISVRRNSDEYRLAGHRRNHDMERVGLHFSRVRWDWSVDRLSSCVGERRFQSLKGKNFLRAFSDPRYSSNHNKETIRGKATDCFSKSLN